MSSGVGRYDKLDVSTRFHSAIDGSVGATTAKSSKRLPANMGPIGQPTQWTRDRAIRSIHSGLILFAYAVLLTMLMAGVLFLNG